MPIERKSFERLRIKPETTKVVAKGQVRISRGKIAFENPDYSRRELGVWHKTSRKYVFVKEFGTSSSFVRAMLKYLTKYDPEKKSIYDLTSECNSIIDNLRLNGIDLPKMRATVLNNNLTIISQDFHSTKKRLSQIKSLSGLSEQSLSELADIYAKTIDAGYIPYSNYVLEFNSEGKGKSFIPYNVESLLYRDLEKRISTDPDHYFSSHIINWFLEFLEKHRITPVQLRTFSSLLLSKIYDSDLKNQLREVYQTHMNYSMF